MITYKVALCIGAESNGEKPLVIKCHDTGFNLRVSLFVRRIGTWQDELERYTIPVDGAAVLKISKPDGTYCVSDGVIDSNKIFFSIPQQAFTVAGNAKAEVSVYDANGRRVSSATFCIEVPQECIRDGAEQSKDYIDIVGQQVATAVEAAKRAEEAAERAEEAGGGGGEGGGGSGEDGGYYTPVVTQPSTDTMEVSYVPSKSGMDSVPPVTVQLPAGPAGDMPVKGIEYFTEADKDEMVNAVLGELPASGGISVTDDGEGNVSIVTSAGVSITDDGNGNVTIV